MRRLMRLASLVAVTGLLAAGCASSPSGGSSGGGNTVRVANIPAGLGAAIPLGMESGDFAEAGLDVENKIFSQETDAIDAVLGGQLDVAVASTFGAVTRLQSDRLVILSSLSVSPPGWHQFAARDSIKGEDDLAGSKIGYVAGTSEQWVTDEYLEHVGLDGGEVERVSFNALFDMVTALQTGDIDGAWVWGDGVAQVEESDDIDILFDDSVVYPGTNGLLVSTEEYAEKNQDTIAELLTAIDAVNQRIPEDPDGTAATVAKATKGDVASLERAFGQNEYEVRMSDRDLDTIEKLGEWAVGSGSFKIPDEVSSYLRLDALEQAFPDRVGGGQ